MARNFNGTSDKILHSAAGPITDYPFTFAAWFKDERAATDTAPGGLVTESDSVSNDKLVHLWVEGNGTIRVVRWVVRNVGDDFVAGQVIGTVDIADGEWHHAAGVGTSATDRAVFTDGADKQTTSTSRTLGTMNRLSSGVRSRASDDHFQDGDIAEPAMWNVALTDDEIAALARGVRPVKIRPNNRVFHWALWGVASPEPDLSGSGRDGTVTGTVRTNHPPITLFTPKWAATAPLIETLAAEIPAARPAWNYRLHA